MGEFNVDKLTGDLIPTAGYGGMIKINGTTLASLVTALADLTEDQKNRCKILIYLNSVTVTNFYVLRRYNKSVGAGGGEVYDTYSNSYVDVSINNETTTLRQASIYLFIYNNNAIVRKAYGSNGYDLTSSVTSWSILYQDDSVTGGNTYPASQVLLEDGETSVEDAIYPSSLQISKNNSYVGSYSYVSVAQHGDIVVVSGTFEVSTTKPAGQNNYLFSGLPIPKPRGYVVVPVCNVNNVRLLINSGGYLSSNDSIEPGVYYITCSYICEK